MTSVCFVKSKKVGFSSFESSGHSGYAEEGHDIVCAAVSSATELVIGILEKFSVKFALDIREDTALVVCRISDCDSNAAKAEAILNIVGGFADYINEVASVYPEYLKCIITEK